MLPGTLQETEFFGREAELGDLRRRVLQAERGLAQSAYLSGPRGIGKTELLKQLFSSLFWRQDRVVPFFYSINPALVSAASFSRSYLTQFLYQRIAFEKKEQALLYIDGVSLDELSILVEEREARWAREVLEKFARNAGDPLSALHIALNAPQQSVLTTGVPVAVLIDGFHRVKKLSIGDNPDPRLASLFEVPMSFRKTPHIIAGNEADLRDMPVSSGLERIAVPPLGLAIAATGAGSLLHAHHASKGSIPQALLIHLGGNPLYLRRVVLMAATLPNPTEADFWKAYAHEITEGSLALAVSSHLKCIFPDLELRRLALTAAYKVSHSNEPLACHQLARTFSLSVDQAEAIAHGLYRADIARGEFGVLRSAHDRVVRDIIETLFRREILGKASHDLAQEILERSSAAGEEVVSYEITLPMIKEAELVAAQCLEQIGKNLHMHQDAVGQLQIAVIEACINAMEHSKGTDNRVYVGVVAGKDRLEVSIESEGQEFVALEGGEPAVDREQARTSGRGWGIKLMKRYADEVKFEKTARGTKTTLIKKLEPTAGVKKEDAISHE
ncbi:MAG TPA: ATP-binding protein [Nitrospirota bacterium]|nr:ATP-binding protein [Nitrospirota bacterium]